MINTNLRVNNGNTPSGGGPTAELVNKGRFTLLRKLISTIVLYICIKKEI
jgi:hypothetical protein